MKKSLLSVCLAAAAAFAAVASSAFLAARESIAMAYRAATAWAFTHVRDALAMSTPAKTARPVAQFAQVRAFVARMTRRERLRMTPGWRMCPST